MVTYVPDIINNSSIKSTKNVKSIEELNAHFSGNNTKNTNDYSAFFHLNICSIRKNFDSFLLSLELIENKPKIIVLSEIWIYEHEKSLYNINGYNSFYSCNNNYRSGGVVAFVDNNITVNNVNIFDMTNADNIYLELSLSNIDFSILGIYRLQFGSTEIFINELENILQNIKIKNCIITGDTNINLLKNGREKNLYLEVLQEHGFHSIINDITKPNRNFTGGTCLDHFMVRLQLDTNLNSAILNSNTTDHYPISILIQNPKPDNINRKENKYTKTINYTLLESQIKNENWIDVYEITDVNDCFNLFQSKILTYIEDCSETKKLNSKNIKIKPWVTLGLLNSIRKRDDLFKKYKLNPQNIAIKNNYLNYRNNLRKLLYNTKTQYYKNLLENETNIKKQWQTLNELTGNKRKTNNVIKSIKSNNLALSKKIDIANHLNSYFSDVGPQISLTCSKININNTLKNSFSYKTIQDSLNISNIQQTEVEIAIKSLKTNKSPGTDGITPKIIKNLNQHISPVLTYIINQSFNQGAFPNFLKTSLVIPLYKSGQKDLPNNYRPIALLPIFSKIFEKVAKTRIQEFLSAHNFFADNQYGFLPKKNTELALVNFNTFITKNLDKHNKVSGLFIDIQKAFDTVSHNKLLKILEHAGVRGKEQSWCKSFLNGRKQMTKVENSLSNCQQIKTGVPQGSVLGPLFFVIYMNSLFSGSFKGKLIAFADDTVLLYSNKTWEENYVQLTHDLNLLITWFSMNDMLINASKTKYINFSYSKHIQFPLELKYHINCNLSNNTCNCQIIEQTKSIKYLGIIVDENLNFKLHIEQINKKLKYILSKFYFIKKIIPKSLKKTLYFAMVQSLLSYGIAIWGGVYRTNLLCLITKQKAFVRCIEGCGYRDHTEPLFTSLKILNLNELYCVNISKLIHQNHKQLLDLQFTTTTKIFVPRVERSTTQRMFFYLGPKVYNTIPLELKNLTSKNFAKNIKAFFLHNNNVNILLSRPFDVAIV